MYAIKTKDCQGQPYHMGRFHSDKHAERCMKDNLIKGSIVKLPPYELATFTISHEFFVFNNQL